MYDIISIGDATIDTVVTISDASLACKLDKTSCLLQLRYGDKLPVDAIAQKVAGNAANNAVGCARMGKKAGFFTILGTDNTGTMIAEEMKANGVDDALIGFDKKNGTNASTVVHYKGDRTILVYHAPRKYKLPRLPKSDWVYYTSVGEGHEKMNKQVIAHVKKTGAKLGYNPGTYQFLAGKKEVQAVCAVTHVLFVNIEEAGRIVGKKKDIKAYHRALHKLGVKIVVITDGPNGSFVYDGETHWQMGIYSNIPVVERTGAGDSFAVGFITSLMDGREVPEAMMYGSMNSSSVIQAIGPQDGLLTKAGQKKFLRKWGKLQAQEF